MTQQDYINRFVQLSQYKIGLTQAKNSDYAGPSDAFKNFQLIEVITDGKISTAAGILVRMTDKLQRIANLMARPPQVTSESLDDACNDLSVYSDILFLWNTRNQTELTFPGQVARQQEAEVAASIPEGASPNTADDVFDFLMRRVEEGGAGALSIVERVQFESLLRQRYSDPEITAMRDSETGNEGAK